MVTVPEGKPIAATPESTKGGSFEWTGPSGRTKRPPCSLTVAALSGGSCLPNY